MLLALCIIWFSVVDHGAECCFMLLAIGQNAILRCWPWCRVWIFDVGHGTEYKSVLWSWSTMWFCVVVYGPQCGSMLLTMVQNILFCISGHGAEFGVV
jgi:hypothetical protein